ncbi:hypothetical protein KP509_03G091500 [Ceratopteris richardii]|uniref:WD repeat-containing protein 11 n=1 Tax=Ceratopteris richardii TaxID=49495 RepID=A0A8T2V507_CERRI|nr:hypothetical protein KP509_03G091500 [Ceratopteris richardii]KAH7442492.1 hypothetical protein KP509_03G091500 [Ceratopteris richardii]KAH7442493.1 hypothetical protein KP509_03G091500 [Ceratopteris richardii]
MALPQLGLPGVAGMLVAPAVKENNGSCHCSSHGLLAYGAGSSIVIIDVRSMQLVTVLPMPSPGTTAFQPAPFVTSVQWTPEGLQRDLTQESPISHLKLAVGDKQGRISIWNISTGEICTWLGFEGERAKLGIQDMCWVGGQPWFLIVIHGPSLISLWDTSSGRSVWRLDATPEILGCIKCDPFDARQVCVIGSKGLVLSLQITGLSEVDVVVKQYQLNILEERVSSAVSVSVKSNGGSADRDSGKDAVSGSSAGSSTTANQTSGSLVGNNPKCLFSTNSRGILFIMFPREFFVFDLQFGTMLSSSGLPRGCGKLLELIAVDGDILYCAHMDGRLTVWRKKGNQQVYSLCHMDALLPALGTSVPAPAVLSVVNCSFQLGFGKSGSGTSDSTSSMRLPSMPEPGSVPLITFMTHVTEKNRSVLSDSKNEKHSSSETRFLSLSDDGRLWHWSVLSIHLNNCSVQSKEMTTTAGTSHILKSGECRESCEVGISENTKVKLGSNSPLLDFKLVLTGQLSLLPSAITTLAVPVPSMLATAPGGGNGPAVSVPLVALATQGGTIELVDAISNSITSSFQVHNSSVRGLRWLGNSRIVSFSYTEIKGKGGGFVNFLAVTCARSGQSKPFRTLQKPERAPIRALRTSPSGRYLLILFREAPAEVWAMTKVPQMLRSLALPFTVMEWALPPAPKIKTPSQTSSSWRSSLFYKERPSMASTVTAMNVLPSSPASDSGSDQNTEASQEDLAESFAFALVNGSLGVFELRGRRVRDFRPKWPSASFVSADVLVTAMAYRTPHVVMGDRSGNIRWWDVSSGLSSTFNSHRGGVRRIKFAPVAVGDQTRGRVAALFNDHTFGIYDLNTQDPLKSAIFQSQIGGVLVLELDWFPLRFDESESFLLCIAGADSSFRLLEVNMLSGSKSSVHKRMTTAERIRPIPLCSPALLPLPHALAFRMLLQLGVRPTWFSDYSLQLSKGSNEGADVDLRNYMLEKSLPGLGEVVVAELLLKTLEPYRKAGRLLDLERAWTYAALASKSCTLRFAFAAAHFGDFAEAAFWLQLPHSLSLLCRDTSGPLASNTTTSLKSGVPLGKRHIMEPSVMPNEIDNDVSSNPLDPVCCTAQNQSELLLPVQWGLEIVPNDQDLVCVAARERILWHEKLQEPEAIQKRVHELVSVGDFEAAVTLLLSSSPNSSSFYVDALRAIALASTVSPALHELAVKVVAANLVATENSLSGTHLLCAVGCYQEACTQLQDTGRWIDAATLAAAHLQGTDYSRVLLRWADHVLHNERNLWRAMILYVAAGALMDALAALRDAKQPDSAAMFLLACHEFNSSALSDEKGFSTMEAASGIENAQTVAKRLNLPGDLNEKEEEMNAVCEFYGQYQIALAHLCTGIAPVIY